MLVIVVEPGPSIAALLRNVLSEQGYVVHQVSTAEKCRKLVQSHEVDAMVLAAALPDGDGVDFCRELRTLGINAPVLITLADTSEIDNNQAARIWNAGADGFMVSPCQDLELFIARMRALLRRGRSLPSDVLHAAGIELDLDCRTVTRDGRRIELTMKEFELLHVFMRNPNRILSRTAIGTRVWNGYEDAHSNIVDVCVHHLRAKVCIDGQNCPIKTVRGSGYMFMTTAEDERPTSPPASGGMDGVAPQRRSR